MNACPINGCQQRTREPMCNEHWQLIPMSQQLAIYRRRANLSTSMKPNRRLAAARKLREAVNEAIAVVNQKLMKTEAA